MVPKIVLVGANPTRGLGLETLIEASPSWVVKSAANDNLIERIRRKVAPGSLTVLFQSPGEAEDDELTRGMAAVEEHHGPLATGGDYDALIIIGYTRAAISIANSRLQLFKDDVEEKDGCFVLKKKA